MAMWWAKKQGAEGEEKLEVPEELQKKLDGAASKEDLGELKTTLQKLQESMALLSTNAAAEAEERRKASSKKASEEAAARGQQTEEELAELALTDPVAAMKRVVSDSLGGRDNALLTLNASNLKREVFEDQEKYPFYTGAIKDEVDKILSQQTLNARNDRSVIEHAYHSIVGQHYRELSEGKLKTRFASSEGDRGSQGKAGEGAEHKAPRRMTEDEIRAGAMLGFDKDTYAKMLDEEGVGLV